MHKSMAGVEFDEFSNIMSLANGKLSRFHSGESPSPKNISFFKEFVEFMCQRRKLAIDLARYLAFVGKRSPKLESGYTLPEIFLSLPDACTRKL